jgi:thiol-disulfide isomerase/thioredoxin
MPFVIAGLVLVGTVALLNLVLLIVILRRWQELENVQRHSARMAEGPQPGDVLPEFTATALSGQTLSDGEFQSGNLLLGVFSQDCPACVDRLPEFVELADRARESGGRIVAMVTGDNPMESHVMAGLTGVAEEIVTDPEAKPLFNALRVAAFPTFLSYRDGVVTDPAADRAPVRAAH